MRQSLFFLFLLATLPAATAHAVPYAEYNPATGDVTLKELNGVVEFLFNSKNGLLNKTIGALPPLYSPPNAVPPLVSDNYVAGPGYILRWTPSAGESQFKFNSLTILQAVEPFTPHANELQFGARFAGEEHALLRELRIVPEPATIALGGLAIVSLTPFRRRK